jgi:putative tryptophan/tyrosine transport system substrate-binding protein
VHPREFCTERETAGDVHASAICRRRRTRVHGANFPYLFRRSVGYVDKILKGANPGDLLVQQPVKFELFLNLRTAKALGLTIPPSVLPLADQVIE